MKARILFLAVALLAPLAMSGQDVDGVVHVKQFPGFDVGTKVTNAMQSCVLSNSPCVLVIDPSLAVYDPGVMPTMCRNCWLKDYRTSQPGAGITVAPQSLFAYGDSITKGLGLTDYETSYVNRMANHFGIGMQGVTNRAISGDQACDVSEGQMFPNDTPAPGLPQALTALMVGTDDAGNPGAGPYVTGAFVPCFGALLTYGAITSDYKAMGSTMVAGSTGGCSLDTHYAATGNQGIICPNAGSTFGTTLVLSSPGPLYIWSRAIDGDTGAGTYAVVNSQGATVATGNITTALSVPLQTNTAHGHTGHNTATVLSGRVPLLPPDTYHVNFTVTKSGNFNNVGVGTIPTASVQSRRIIEVGDLPNRQDEDYQSNTDAYRTAIVKTVNQLQNDGLNNIILARASRVAMSTAAGDVAVDGYRLHPNATGHLELYNEFMDPLKAMGGWQEMAMIQSDMIPDNLFTSSPSLWNCHDGSMVETPGKGINGNPGMVFSGTSGASSYCNSATLPPVTSGENLVVGIYMDATQVTAGNPTFWVKDSSSGATVGKLTASGGYAGFYWTKATVQPGTTSVYAQVNAIGVTGPAVYSSPCVAEQYGTAVTLCAPGPSPNGATYPQLPAGCASTGCHISASGLTAATSGTFLASAPAATYKLCGYIWVTATTATAGTIGGSASFNNGTFASSHSFSGNVSATGLNDDPTGYGGCYVFRSGAGQSISFYTSYTGVSPAASATYSVDATLFQLTAN